MAVHCINATIFLAQYDISGNCNAVALDYSADLLDATAMGVGQTRSRLAGFLNATCEVNGWWDAANPDALLFNRVGLADSVFTVSEGGGSGDIAYFFKPMWGTYTPFGGGVGEVQPFRAGGETTTNLVRGRILAAKASRTISAAGTAYQLGPVSATQSLYGALHVFSASGTNPTLDVIVRSDALVGMGSPETRITFAQKTGAGHEWKTAAGPITDTWYQVSWTIGGADTPTFGFAVVVGIDELV